MSDNIYVTKSPKRVQLEFDPEKEPSRTKQADARGRDLRSIIERYQRTGEQPPWASKPHEALYENFTSVGEYMDMFLRVQSAQEAFDALPAKVRDHFQNSPQKLVEAWHDPEQGQLLLDLGLIDPEAVEGEKTASETVPEGVNPETGEVTPEGE